LEPEQLPGYTDKKRPMSDTLCDCEVSVCCGFTVIAFLFLSAWNVMVHEIPPDQFSETMFPYYVATIIGIIIWLTYKVYTRLTRKSASSV
jgi:amino acid permease